MKPLPPNTWRLIRHSAAAGAWNMAVDEAILEAATLGAAPPTLRLYAWSPPCLSLGYAQPFAEVDPSALRRRGWHVVRRPTGGRAILHTDELTYSICGPETEPRLAGSVLESYRVLAGALLAALIDLGIPARAHEKAAPAAPAGGQPLQNPVCFEVPSSYEITVFGKKLIGSAQRRSRGGVLQHGSLPLHGDLTRITRALVFAGEEARRLAAERLLDRAATAEHVLNRPLPWPDAADALAGAFAKTLNLDFVESDLTPEETRRAEALAAEKYAHASWTERV